MARSSAELGQEQTEVARFVFVPSLGLLSCIVYKAEKVIHSSLQYDFKCHVVTADLLHSSVKFQLPLQSFMLQTVNTQLFRSKNNKDILPSPSLPTGDRSVFFTTRG